MINNWIKKTLRKIKKKRPIKKLSKKKIAEREKYLKHKEQARVLAIERLEIYNQIYQYKYNRISIRDQKTRWGSCSSKGNINFNYKIALLPLHLADYIIVHELCHIGEMNHSERFWSLVAREIPNHRELKVEIRKIRL